MSDDQRQPDDQQNKPASNPLRVAWLCLTTVGSVAALSNMIKDIAQWKGIILTALETYESYVYPILDVIFFFI